MKTASWSKRCDGVSPTWWRRAYQPTCENMVADFARVIAGRLPERVELYSVRLHETATSFAEWFAEDNR